MVDVGSAARTGNSSYKISGNPTMVTCHRSSFSLTPQRPRDLEVPLCCPQTQSSRAESPGPEQGGPGRYPRPQPGHSSQHCQSPSSEPAETRPRAERMPKGSAGVTHEVGWTWDPRWQGCRASHLWPREIEWCLQRPVPENPGFSSGCRPSRRGVLARRVRRSEHLRAAPGAVPARRPRGSCGVLALHVFCRDRLKDEAAEKSLETHSGSEDQAFDADTGSFSNFPTWGEGAAAVLPRNVVVLGGNTMGNFT